MHIINQLTLFPIMFIFYYVCLLLIFHFCKCPEPSQNGTSNTWVYMYICTSLPVPASMSRNRSTSALTSLAALALLTLDRNGRVNLMSPPSSENKKQQFNRSYDQNITFQLWYYIPKYQSHTISSVKPYITKLTLVLP